MAKFNSITGRAAGLKRGMKENNKGRYIVAYRLIRKNAVRHECFRADTLQKCAEYIMQQTHTDRYYSIYDYNWTEVPIE